jgi:hypothetical protein
MMNHMSCIKQSSPALVLGTVLAIGSMSQANAETENVQQVQTWLTQLGFEPGPIDGSYGGRTKQALEAFYQGRGGSFDGEISKNEILELREAMKAAGLLGQDVTQIANSKTKFSLVNVTEQQRFTYLEKSEWGVIPQGMAVFDVDENGINEVYWCFKEMPGMTDIPNVTFTKIGLRIEDVTDRVFGQDIPTSNACSYVMFSDLNADGKKDLVYSEAGTDIAPWNRTSAVEILINTGSAFKRITQNFEKEISGMRNYAVGVGNLDTDEFGEILLPSGLDIETSKVLDFDANGDAAIRRNPLIDNLPHTWHYYFGATNYFVEDFDKDGRSDLYIGGTMVSPPNSILWGGLSSKQPAYLPETFLGWTHYGDEIGIGGDVNSIVSSDFDNDGDHDLVLGIERVDAIWKGDEHGYETDYSKGSILQILEQISPRQFEDKTAVTGNDLGATYIQPMIVYDLNSDGLEDIIVNYWMKSYFIEEKHWLDSNLFGSMFLINKGGMRFERQLASEMPGYNKFMEGMIFPLSSENDKISVMVLQPRSRGMGTAQRYVDGYLADLTFE